MPGWPSRRTSRRNGQVHATPALKPADRGCPHHGRHAYTLATPTLQYNATAACASATDLPQLRRRAQLPIIDPQHDILQHVSINAPYTQSTPRATPCLPGTHLPAAEGHPRRPQASRVNELDGHGDDGGYFTAHAAVVRKRTGDPIMTTVTSRAVASTLTGYASRVPPSRNTTLTAPPSP